MHLIRPDEALVKLIDILIDDESLDRYIQMRLEDLAQEIEDARRETEDAKD